MTESTEESALMDCFLVHNKTWPAKNSVSSWEVTLTVNEEAKGRFTGVKGAALRQVIQDLQMVDNGPLMLVFGITYWLTIEQKSTFASQYSVLK